MKTSNRSIILVCTVIVLLSTSTTIAQVASSPNYQLHKYGLLAGNPDEPEPPSSANFNLKENAIGGIANDSLFSVGYIHYPGYLVPEFAEILPPQNIVIYIAEDAVHIEWDAVPGTTSYKVYSSDNPYSEFDIDNTGTYDGTSWVAPISLEKRFYYVKAIKD